MRFGTGVVIAALAIALASWYGFGLVKARLATFWQGEAFDNRMPLWLRLLPMAGDFPLWGTGYGTFVYVESLYRADVRDAHLVYDHAHNEYLELLTEAGVPALILAVIAIGLVYRLGWRGMRLRERHPGAGLLLGALFAFTTLIVHSFGEFGLHVPAITLLATVLCAQACAAGSTPAGSRRGRAPVDAEGAGAFRLRLWGAAPLAGAVTCVLLGVVLSAASWQTHRADRLKVAASMTAVDRPDGLQLRIAYLRAAVSQTPADAELQLLLGNVCARSYENDKTRLLGEKQATAAAGLTAWAAGLTGSPAAAALWTWPRPGQRRLAYGAEPRVASQSLLLALRSFLCARDGCPLLPGAQLALAEYANELEHADGQSDYLARAKFVAPCDPDVWYTCGLQELAAAQPEHAWASWRRCLELSDTYLPEILKATASLGPEERLAKLLPERPGVLVAVASRLAPGPAGLETRRPILEKALSVLATRPAPLSPEELHVKAQVHEGLGQTDEAVAAYDVLLAQDLRQVEYRHELARLLFTSGRLERAHGELLNILSQQPGNGAARELLAAVAHELARKR